MLYVLIVTNGLIDACSEYAFEKTLADKTEKVGIVSVIISNKYDNSRDCFCFS